jgi:hypothetical protein
VDCDWGREEEGEEEEGEEEGGLGNEFDEDVADCVTG